MCGIVGAFWRNRLPGAERLLSDALDHLRLHGPDDRGAQIEELSGGTLAFGLARRPIVDLSSAGHQPMRSALVYRIRG